MPYKGVDESENSRISVAVVDTRAEYDGISPLSDVPLVVAVRNLFTSHISTRNLRERESARARERERERERKVQKERPKERQEGHGE